MTAALTAAPALADAVLTSHHWHRDGDWFPWFPLVPLCVVGLWVLLVVFVVRRRWRTFPGQSAEGVLAERYARGEIDEREYRERRSVLRAKG